MPICWMVGRFVRSVGWYGRLWLAIKVVSLLEDHSPPAFLANIGHPSFEGVKEKLE